MKEVWQTIAGCEHYQVSNLGRVMSLSRFVKRNGFDFRIAGGIVKTRVTEFGYVQVEIKDSDGKRKTWKLHRLLATTFIPNPDNKPEVNHRNGIKTDNNLENLEWVTRSENMKHAFATGLKHPTVGSDHKLSKMTDEIVMALRTGKVRNIDVSRDYGVSLGAVKCAKNGKNWKHLPKVGR